MEGIEVTLLVVSYAEAKDLFNYAERRISSKDDVHREFWLGVRNNAISAMNELKNLEE